MSSSCRNRFVSLLALAGCAAGTSHAQQTYFLPSFETSAEWHKNRDLSSDPAQEKENGVYYVRAEALVGRVTTTSSVEFRPWISYQEVPDRQDTEPLELGANLRTLTQTLKGAYRFNARFLERGAFTSELGSAGFDEFDPDNTPAGETGVITVKSKRRDWTVYPNLSYQISDRTRIEASLDAGQVRYDSNLAFRRVGYQSGTLEATVVYRMSRRLELVAGPYVSKYESDDNLNKTDSYGLVLGTGYAPAESAFVIAQLRAERADVESTTAQTGLVRKDKQNSVGVEIVGHYSWPASRIRYNVGRFLEPSTIGSRVKNDVVRVQYSRSLSTRTTVIAAVRYSRENRLEDRIGETTNERSYADVWASYQLTPTWYVGGGYRFIRQDITSEPRAANDHSVFVNFGYRALDPRPRRAQ